MKGTPSLLLSGKNTSQAVLADWARRASAFEEKLDEQRLQPQALGSGRTAFANVYCKRINNPRIDNPPSPPTPEGQ